MREENLTIKIYKFDELPEETQNKIIENWRENNYNYYLEEYHDTLVEFCKIFDLNLKSYSYGGLYNPNEHITVNFQNEDYENLTGYRLNSKLWKKYSQYIIKKNIKYKNNKKYISNIKFSSDCPLTGTCFDNDILEPIIKFMYNPDNNTNFSDLIDNCLYEFIKSAVNSVEFWYSEECIREEIECSDYEFTEVGEIY